MLFFHVVQLRFVVGLKIGKFQPDYAGNLAFYRAADDDKLRTPAPNRTFGIPIAAATATNRQRTEVTAR